MLNKKLLNQLEQIEISEATGPSANQWRYLLDEINSTYENYEREKLNNNLVAELGFQEMQNLFKQLGEREALIKNILDSSQDCIITLDYMGQIIEFNNAAEKIFSIRRSDIKGQSIFTLIQSGTLFEKLKLCFLEQTAQEIVFFRRAIKENMQINGVDIFFEVFFNKEGSGLSAIYPLYLKDLTQQIQAEELIEKSRAQIEASSKLSSLGEMAGGMAHEINTPLAVIQMRTDQLLESLSEEEVVDKVFFAKALNAIDQTVRKISKIVRGLKTFARDGKTDSMEESSIHQIVDDTFTLCRERFYNNEVTLNFKSLGDVKIFCRPVELSQVLLNLLNNAFDAIQELNEKWIVVDLVSSETEIYLSVTDSGQGIPLDLQNKLMQPFFTTKEVGKGTGLGLSISKGLVEGHSGQLLIDNTSLNTKFTIIIPKHQMSTKEIL